MPQQRSKCCVWGRWWGPAEEAGGGTFPACTWRWTRAAEHCGFAADRAKHLLFAGKLVSSKTWWKTDVWKKNKGKSRSSCISKKRDSKKYREEKKKNCFSPKCLGIRDADAASIDAAVTLNVAFSLTAVLIPRPFEVSFYIFVICLGNR